MKKGQMTTKYRRKAMIIGGTVSPPTSSDTNQRPSGQAPPQIKAVIINRK
jgi:hypothetical protein